LYNIDSLSSRKECGGWAKTFIIDTPLLSSGHRLSPRKRDEGPTRWVFGMQDHGACLKELHRRFGRPPIRFDLELMDAVKRHLNGVVSFSNTFPKPNKTITKEIQNHPDLLLAGSQTIWNHRHVFIEELISNKPEILYEVSTEDGTRHVLTIHELKNGRKKIHRIGDVLYVAECSCGGVKASISSEPQMLVKCHCVDCRKYTGIGPVLWGMFDAEQVCFQVSSKTITISNRTHCEDCQELVYMRHGGNPNPYINLHTLHDFPFTDEVLQELLKKDDLIVAHQHVTTTDPTYLRDYVRPDLPIHEGDILDAGGEEMLESDLETNDI